MTWYPRSPVLKARIAGAFWLMVFVAGMLTLSIREGVLSSALTTIATLCYLIVTLLLYDLLKPVNSAVALLAAVFGLAGCAISLFHLAPIIHVRDLVFFGLQCVLVGYLIFKSTFLPRLLGVLLVLAGLGWLTFVSESLVKALSPYNLIPGMIGEGALLLWLLVKGVNVQRWNESDSISRLRSPA